MIVTSAKESSFQVHVIFLEKVKKGPLLTRTRTDGEQEVPRAPCNLIFVQIIRRYGTKQARKKKAEKKKSIL